MENAALELSREGGGSGYPWRQVGVVLERQCVPGQTGQAKAHQLQFVAERHYCPNTAVAFFAIHGGRSASFWRGSAFRDKLAKQKPTSYNSTNTMPVSPIPEGYHSVTPYLVMKNAAAAIEFYKKAFGAVELLRMAAPGGKIGHAEIKIGDSPVMLADEYPDMGFKGPESLGGTPVSLMIYVDDVDKIYPQAIAAGGKEVRPLQNQFYGDRSGTLTDPFGHVWTISTHVEDVPEEELAKRAEAAMKEAGLAG